MESGDNENLIAVALNTLTYIISSDNIGYIGQTVDKIVESAKEIYMNLPKESRSPAIIKNLPPLLALLKAHPSIGNLKLEATSGMFRHAISGSVSEFTRDFNPGVNTFRFYDEQNDTVYYAERGTAPGEWGYDNADMVTAAFTGQNMQALDVRKRFEESSEVPKHPDAKTVESGHSKGGHKALVCHIYKLSQEIILIHENEKMPIAEKSIAIQKVIDNNKCTCIDSPCLSKAGLDFFYTMLEPVYDAGLIPKPEIFIENTLSKSITRISSENDYISSLNERNALGENILVKQRHGGAVFAHEIAALYGTELDSQTNKLIYTGQLNETVETPGPVHVAASKLVQSITSSGDIRGEMTAILIKVDEKRGHTECDVTGSKYNEFLITMQQKERSAQKTFKKSKKSDFWSAVKLVIISIFDVGFSATFREIRRTYKKILSASKLSNLEVPKTEQQQQSCI